MRADHQELLRNLRRFDTSLSSRKFCIGTGKSMTEDLLGYNEMVETAMRTVVREALERAGDDGLPGEHHFYITLPNQFNKNLYLLRRRE